MWFMTYLCHLCHLCHISAIVRWKREKVRKAERVAGWWHRGVDFEQSCDRLCPCAAQGIWVAQSCVPFKQKTATHILHTKWVLRLPHFGASEVLSYVKLKKSWSQIPYVEKCREERQQNPSPRKIPKADIPLPLMERPMMRQGEELSPDIHWCHWIASNQLIQDTFRRSVISVILGLRLSRLFQTFVS